MELSVEKILSLMLLKLKYIILIALIFAIGAFGYTKLCVDEQYTSSSKFLVVMDVTTSKTSEASFVKEAIHSYLEIFNTTKFFNEIADIYNDSEEGYRYTASQLKAMTSMQPASNEDAPSFTVRVVSGNPDMCYDLANIVSSHMIDKAAEYEVLNKIQMIDDPIKPISPSSPNIFTNTVLGLIAGVILATVMFICKEMFNHKIKNLEDIKSCYDIPILGVVPDTSIEEKTSSGKISLLKKSKKEEN